MNSPNPALVTQRGAARLPRIALWLLCAAYLLPGLFGRDPWRNADMAAFGYMRNLALGTTSWGAPTVGGIASDAALLPYWLGAAFIRVLGFLHDPALAARLPFALLLMFSLALTSAGCFRWARSPSAQPLAFAFGGEANPADYARAIADGAVLAMIASLGLLQLGHETTPELAQLACVSLLLYGLAHESRRSLKSSWAVLAALPGLAASGAPSMAVAYGLVCTVVVAASSQEMPRRRLIELGLSTCMAIAVSYALGAWAWRIETHFSAVLAKGFARQLAWFLWPLWPLAVWTLWRWRRQVINAHIALPLACAGIAVCSSLAMGGSDRALMLALPPLAILAAFALPTLTRSTAAAVDWFSVFFFSIGALSIWVVYSAMQTGVPTRVAANVARLTPGFTAPFSPVAMAIALLGTAAWLWLVRWRTGRNRHPLWKSLVLPAGGAVLCWLLVMTLWLPHINHARSYGPLVASLSLRMPHDGCIGALNLPRGAVAALEFFGGYQVNATTAAHTTPCTTWLLLQYKRQAPIPLEGWVLVDRLEDRQDLIAIYRRRPGVAAGT